MAVTVDSIVVIRRSGRPRVAETRATVCAWVPAPVHDRLIQVANQRGTSVSSVAREALMALVDTQRPVKLR